MTPDVIEETYLMAKEDASQSGARAAARNFDVKHKRYNRKKNFHMAIDTKEPLTAVVRLRKLVDVAINVFLDLSCGYLTKVGRSAFITFGVIPIGAALLFAQGGPFLTNAGSIWSSTDPVAVLGDSLYYSYITFTSVGYGDIGPKAAAHGAKLLAVLEGCLGLLYGVLFTATLLNRIDY
jgi:hypothetical protein